MSSSQGYQTSPQGIFCIILLLQISGLGLNECSLLCLCLGDVFAWSCYVLWNLGESYRGLSSTCILNVCKISITCVSPGYRVSSGVVGPSYTKHGSAWDKIWWQRGTEFETQEAEAPGDVIQKVVLFHRHLPGNLTHLVSKISGKCLWGRSITAPLKGTCFLFTLVSSK